MGWGGLIHQPCTNKYITHDGPQKTQTHTNGLLLLPHTRMPELLPLLLGYFLLPPPPSQCLGSIPGVALLVTPSRSLAHGQMSGCLLILGYKCVHMFSFLAFSLCVTTQRDLHGWRRRLGSLFTGSGPHQHRQKPPQNDLPCPLLCPQDEKPLIIYPFSSCSRPQHFRRHPFLRIKAKPVD